MTATTGSPALDRLLGGGIPDRRVVLVVGGPSTGKTTFGLQFLQEGLSRGERCLFVSTEQTPADLRETYRSFRFDLDHENLTLTTIHQTPKDLLEGEGEGLAISTLGPDEEDPFCGIPVPFEPRYVEQYLEHFAGHDRVVLDSVSGLAPFAESQQGFRRSVLDLVRFFSEEMRATTLFTVEESERATHQSAEADLLQFTGHGVIRLFQEDVSSTLHRYLRIRKMRGVDHDQRKHEYALTPAGIDVYPQQPRASPVYEREPLSTGVEGIDRLCGGGLLPTQPVVVQHDGRISVDPLVTSIMCESFENGGGVVLFTPAHLTPERLDGWLAGRAPPVRELLDDDRLFVLDWFDSWGFDHENIFPIHRGGLRELLLNVGAFRDPLFRRLYKRIDGQRGERDVVSIVYTETILQDLSPETIRFQARWVQSKVFNENDVLVVTHNPEVMDKRLAEFFVYDAAQVFNVWREGGDLNYVSVEKSPRGRIGSSHLIENLDEPPFVRVRAD
jgi:KaiC/GvpD/RAD55 family RecA-like ATPase